MSHSSFRARFLERGILWWKWGRATGAGTELTP